MTPWELLVELSCKVLIYRPEEISPNPSSILIIPGLYGSNRVFFGQISFHNPILTEIPPKFIILKVPTDIIPHPAIISPFFRKLIFLCCPKMRLDFSGTIFFKNKIPIHHPIK